MKILLLTTHLNIGGIGVYTVNLARHLKAEGVDVAVASGGGDLEEDLAADGVPHVDIDIKTKSDLGLKMWKALPLLVNLVRREGFQLVHAQTRVAQVAGTMAGRLTGVPTVSTCHGFYGHRRLSRRLLPCWGRKVIAISKSVRRHLLEDFKVSPDRAVLVYNGIERDRYLCVGPAKDKDLLKSLGVSGEGIIVGAVGRFSPVKGFRYLVDAFGEIAPGNDRIRLLIVGEGPEKAVLRAQARRLGVEDKVLLEPCVAPLEKYFSVMDIFCLPSVKEGLGLSLMEAMAAGRACIATDVGGLSELIVNGESGILVPPENPEGLKTALARLIDDADFRRLLGRNARKKAAKDFSITDSVKKTIEVYRGIIDEA